jgi:DNA-binding response OmpR family regulator
MATTKILVADDDTAMLPVLALHLRNEEYDVVCAPTGDEAAAAASGEQPDLLVLNVNLSLEDGTSLYAYVSDNPELLAVPVIYLVPERISRGNAPPRLPEQAMVRKPVPVGELLRKINMALGFAEPADSGHRHAA